MTASIRPNYVNIEIMKIPEMKQVSLKLYQKVSIPILHVVVNLKNHTLEILTLWLQVKSKMSMLTLTENCYRYRTKPSRMVLLRTRCSNLLLDLRK